MTRMWILMGRAVILLRQGKKHRHCWWIVCVPKLFRAGSLIYLWLLLNCQRWLNLMWITRTESGNGLGIGRFSWLLSRESIELRYYCSQGCSNLLYNVVLYRFALLVGSLGPFGPSMFSLQRPYCWAWQGIQLWMERRGDGVNWPCEKWAVCHNATTTTYYNWRFVLRQFTGFSLPGLKDVYHGTSQASNKN